MKINNRELQNIAINHFADIDYQDFIKLYRECTKEPYNILTIDTKLPASDPLRFRKNLFDFKILNNKIMQNEAQYDLDKKAAKRSALSSNNLDKYKHLTGEDLGLKPSTIEQAKFEYSPLGKIFNNELDKDDKKEGLCKRLKNIENKVKDEHKKELELIKNEQQSEVLTDESTVVDKKPAGIVLLKDKLDFIFKNFDSNFNSTGKNFLKKLAKDEKKD